MSEVAVVDDWSHLPKHGGWRPSAKRLQAEAKLRLVSSLPTEEGPGALVRTASGALRTVRADVDISAFEPAIDAPGGGLTLLELRLDSCRFTLPGAIGAALRFCGQETEPGETWCPRCRPLAVAPRKAGPIAGAA